MNALGGADDNVDRMRKHESAEVVKVSDKDQAKQKKPRFIWTRDVHNCFLDAVKHLGVASAVPTKILELMNVEDLTRENVASHLQKFRIQEKRKEKERAQVRAASENVPKGVYPHMSGIPQQPRVFPNTMQGINMDCACLDGSQLAPSFANHNIQVFPTVQEVYGTPFKDLFDEGVNRMSNVRLVHGLYDSNGPHDINKIGYNYGQLPPKPSVDSYAHNLMDRHDTTLVRQYDQRDESLQSIISGSSVSQYDRRDECFVANQGIISPTFVPQYDRLDELFAANQGIISPSFVPQYDRLDELFAADQGIISPSFVPQYDRRDELFDANQGILSHLLAQNMEGLGVGVPRPPKTIGGPIGMQFKGIEVGMPPLPTGVLGMKIERFGLGMSRLPESNGIKVEGYGVGVPRPPSGGLLGMKVEGLGLGVPRLPEATGGLAWTKVEGHGLGVPRLPEATGDLAGMNVEGHVPRLPGGFTHGAGVTHLPEATGGPGLGVPQPPEASGGLAGMNNFPEGFPFEDLDLDYFQDVDGNSLDNLYWR